MQTGLIVENIGTLLTMQGQELGTIQDAALISDANGYLTWAGPQTELPTTGPTLRIDARGGLVMPGLVDCHTHLIFGNKSFPRAADFANRLNRDPGYKAGGVYRTIDATRQASDEELLADATQRLRSMAALGVTTVEAKTGYQLTVPGELRTLELIERLKDPALPRIFSTLLACHFVPPEYQGRRGDYVDVVCQDLIPEAAQKGIVHFCDVFVDSLPTAFTPADAEKVARAASDHGLAMKLHVDQTSGAFQGAELAARLGVVSADHIDHSSEAGIREMAKAGVVGVLLPYADLFTRSPMPDARRYLKEGLRVALSTDLNPGSSYTDDLWFTAFLGGALCNMTVSEALRGITVEAAAALGLDKPGGVGRLQPGYKADLIIVDVPAPEVLLYQWRDVPVQKVIRDGAEIHSA